MSAAQSLQYQMQIMAVVLIVSGFISMTLRRHVVLAVMGFHLVVLGVLILFDVGSPSGQIASASVAIGATLLVGPMAMTAFARWRALCDSANRSRLQSVSEGDRSD
jgi:hypothetical protein